MLLIALQKANGDTIVASNDTTETGFFKWLAKHFGDTLDPHSLLAVGGGWEEDIAFGFPRLDDDNDLTADALPLTVWILLKTSFRSQPGEWAFHHGAWMSTHACGNLT